MPSWSPAAEPNALRGAGTRKVVRSIRTGSALDLLATAMRRTVLSCGGSPPCRADRARLCSRRRSRCRGIRPPAWLAHPREAESSRTSGDRRARAPGLVAGKALLFPFASRAERATGGGRRPSDLRMPVPSVAGQDRVGRCHAAGGGCPSIRGSALSKQAQRGALAVHMVSEGCATSGSSKVPTRTKIR